MLPCGHPPTCGPTWHRATFTTRFTDSRALPGGSTRWPGSPDRYQRAFDREPSWSLPASRSPVVRATCADRTASFTRFEALIPLRVRSRRRRPGCPGFGPGSPRSLLETTPCGAAPSPPTVDALLSFTPPETSSRLGPCGPSPACDPQLLRARGREPACAPSSGARPNRDRTATRASATRSGEASPRTTGVAHGFDLLGGHRHGAREGTAPGRATSRWRALLPWPWDDGLPPGAWPSELRSSREVDGLPRGSRLPLLGFRPPRYAPRTRSRTHGRVERPCDRPAHGFGCAPVLAYRFASESSARRRSPAPLFGPCASPPGGPRRRVSAVGGNR